MIEIVKYHKNLILNDNNINNMMKEREINSRRECQIVRESENQKKQYFNKKLFFKVVSNIAILSGSIGLDLSKL